MNMDRLFCCVVTVVLACVLGCNVNNGPKPYTLSSAAIKISQDIAEDIPKGSKVMITDIVDVVNNSRYVSNDMFIENFTTDLVQIENGNFVILGRSIMDQALKELNFQTSDLVDQSKVRKLGKFLGADYIICGTICFNGWQAYLNIRCISVETLQIISASRCLVSN